MRTHLLYTIYGLFSTSIGAFQPSYHHPVVVKPTRKYAKVSEQFRWNKVNNPRTAFVMMSQSVTLTEDITKKRKPATAVYALILTSFLAFCADNILRLPVMNSFYLYHAHVKWWQPITSLFMHANRQHLSGNILLLLLFGRSVEDELGWPGLLFAFSFCGVCSNLLSILLLPSASVSLGASGAVFGLFSVSVLSRLSLIDCLDWRKIIEVIVLGDFALTKMFSEVKVAATGGTAGVNHVAHLGGAGAGVLLVVLLRVLLGKLEQNAEKRST